MEAQMSEFFNCIKQGLDEAVEFSKGQISKAIVHKFSPIDVKNIRSSMDMSQTEFASAFGISVSTLKHWKRGDRVPNGSALVLLNVVKKEPQVVLNALSH